MVPRQPPSPILGRQENMNRGSKRRSLGYTLIEAVVTVFVVGIGIVGAVYGLGVLTKAEGELREREILSRLARQKFDELAATRSFNQGEVSGNFESQGYQAVQWSSESAPTGVENVDSLTLTVTPPSNWRAGVITRTGLLYVPPAPTSTGGTP